MKLAFDFVCDEALVYAGVARRFEAQGALIVGLTMGRRWQEAWEDRFATRSLGDPFAEVSDLDAELARIELEYADHHPASFVPADRFLCAFPRRQQQLVLVNTFRAVERFIEQERPDYYFSTGVAYLYNLVTLAVCARHRIPHIALYVTRDQTPRFTVSLGRWDRWDLVEREYHRLLATDCEESDEYREMADFLDQFQQKATQPYYMSAGRQGFSMRWVHAREFLVRLRYWFLEGWGQSQEDYITRPPWWYVGRDLVKIARAQYVDRRKDHLFDAPADGERYFLFPLHLQPEASTLILAEWYVDQLNTIRNVARALPADALLYVKEHKSALGYHSLAFYRALRSIHNVRLIPHDADTPGLIRGSRGVIVLSSTVGWEALLLERPVYLFGKIFYQGLEGVVRLGGFDDLREALAKKDGPVFTPQGRADLVRFLMAIRRQSFEGIFDVAKLDMRERVVDPDNLDRLFSGLQEVLAQLPKASSVPRVGTEPASFPGEPQTQAR